MLEYGCGHLDASGQVIATTATQYATAKGTCVPFSVNGLFYTGSAHQLWEQFRAAVFVIFWSALITFILMKIIGLVLGGARYKDEILEVGDLAIHGEEAFPEETFAERVGAWPWLVMHRPAVVAKDCQRSGRCRRGSTWKPHDSAARRCRTADTNHYELKEEARQ